MEAQIFTWKRWDQGDTMCFTFYEVELVVDVGEFKAGTRFGSANIDYDESPYVAFYDNDGNEVAKFALSLKIGAAITA